MLIICILFTLAAKTTGQLAQSCFYSRRVTFFQGNTVPTPYRPAGYTFNVAWETPQTSIVNSSVFYTAARNNRAIFLNFRADVISTTSSSGTVMINPLGGSEILSITMNIVLLNHCKATARLLSIELNSIQLSSTPLAVNFDTGIYFKDTTSRYKRQLFVRDFDGYPNNGASSYGFNTYDKAIILDTNIHGFQITAATEDITNFIFMNSIRFTYVLIDIYSFLVTPITQNHVLSPLSQLGYISLSPEFSQSSEHECMIGIKTYVKKWYVIENYHIFLHNQTINNSTYRYQRTINSNFIPSMLCLGFCKQGMGRANNNTCSQCPKLSLTCSNMSYSLTCISGYYPQQMTIGIQKCISCMPACRICTNYTQCIECEPTNLPTQSNNCQKCPINSWLVGGICSSIPGCSSAQSFQNRSVCRSCNPSENFQMNPINNKCICKKGYVLKNGKCIDYCGDGIIFNQECDDNNIINSDGCSSECKQEKGYQCWRENSLTPSECVFKEKVSIELISIERIQLQNRIVLVFRVLPIYYSGLSTEYIKGSLQTNLTINIQSVTVMGRFITVQMTFDQDIDNQTALFSLNFNDSSTTQNQISFLIRFRADQKLVKLNRIKLAKTIKYLFCSAIICLTLIFLVSLKFHKMIGLETVLPFQIIYFVYLLTQDKTQLFSLFQYYAGSALNFLFYINGQSFIQFPITDNTLISNNQNFTLIFLCCVSYSTFFISLSGFLINCLKNSQSKCNENLESFAIKWHNRVSLPIFSWFLTPLIILKSALSINTNHTGFSSSLLVLQCLMMASVIFYEWREAFPLKSFFVQSLEKQPSYIPTALGFLLAVSFVLSASFLRIIQTVEHWLLILCSFFLVIFIYVRPYKGVLDNTGVIVGMVQLLFFLAWGVMRRADPTVETQENQIFGLFISFGLAAANIIIGTLRVFFEALRQYRQNSKKQGEANSLTPQQKNDAATFLKQTVGLQARYETKLVLPTHLKHININCIDTVPFQHFNPISKEKKSQLKKYLMQRINTAKKAKQYFKN